MTLQRKHGAGQVTMEEIWLLMPHSSTAHMPIRRQLPLSHLLNMRLIWILNLANWPCLSSKIPILDSDFNFHNTQILYNVAAPGGWHSLQMLEKMVILFYSPLEFPPSSVRVSWLFSAVFLILFPLTMPNDIDILKHFFTI